MKQVHILMVLIMCISVTATASPKKTGKQSEPEKISFFWFYGQEPYQPEREKKFNNNPHLFPSWKKVEGYCISPTRKKLGLFFMWRLFFYLMSN